MIETDAKAAKQQESMDEKFNKLACQINTQNENQTKHIATQISKVEVMVESMKTCHKADIENRLDTIEDRITITSPQNEEVDGKLDKIEKAITTLEASYKENSQAKEMNPWTNFLIPNANSEIAELQASRENPVKDMFKVALEETEKEKEERENRARNVVIFRAEELDTQVREDRVAKDKILIQELLREIGAEEVQVEDIRRLGKIEENRIRPLRIQLRNPEEKTLIMKRLNKLGDAPTHLKKLAVGHDLTPTQRVERTKLIKEAEAKTSRDSDKTMIHIVKSEPGPRWDPKIVRIKNRKETLLKRP